MQVKHSSVQLKSTRIQAEGNNDGDGSVIRALGLVRRPNEVAVGPSDESKKRSKLRLGLGRVGKKCTGAQLGSKDSKDAKTSLRDSVKPAEKRKKDSGDTKGDPRNGAKTKSSKSDPNVGNIGPRDSRKTDQDVNESKDPPSDTRYAGKAKKYTRSEIREFKVSKHAKGSGPRELKKSNSGHPSAQEGTAGVTAFGPADAEFVFKLDRCKLFSFSRVKKSDLNQRLFGNSPKKKRRK